MTIYTDQVTGKKYDRVHGGVVGVTVPSEGCPSCRDCAFDNDVEQCGRATKHCVSNAPGKAVFFVFKERTA